jgi:hypothetical protein
VLSLAWELYTSGRDPSSQRTHLERPHETDTGSEHVNTVSKCCTYQSSVGQRVKVCRARKRKLLEHSVLDTVARGSIVVKALCYKSEGRGFDTRWGEFLNLLNRSARTRLWSLLRL